MTRRTLSSRPPAVDLVTYVLLFAVSASRAFGATSCPPATTVSPNDPRLPVLRDSYQVSVECNMLDRGYTMQSTIYFDYRGNRAAMKYMDHGTSGSIIYSYHTDEIFNVSGSQCTVKNLTGSPKFEVLFGETWDNGVPHIQHPQTAFRFGGNISETFKGPATVRKLPVLHWQHCTMYKNAPLTIDYYFTNKSWDTASTYHSVPVRAEVQTDQTLPNGTIYHLHHVYDYFDFQTPYSANTDVFQIPRGMYCPGRKSGPPLPKLPKSFHFKVEVVENIKSLITYFEIAYDDLHNLMRIDYRPINTNNPTQSKHPVKEIHDLNAGLRYVIDKSTNNCTALPLQPNGIDIAENASTSIYYLKDPRQLFRLDYNYTYQGQYLVRDVTCDVFVSEQGFPIPLLNSTINATVTVYFLAKTWTVYPENGGPEANYFSTPVKMEIKSPEFWLIYNFLDFDVTAPLLSTFDVTPCYSEDKQLKFQVQFPGDYISTSGPSLRQLAQHKFADVMGVSPLRLHESTVDYDDTSIYITSTILDKAPALPQFTHTGDVRYRVGPNSYDNVNTAAQCAKLCVGVPIPCNSFDLCPSTSSCFTYSDRFPNINPLPNVGNCRHYSRNVNGLLPEPSIDDAYQTLRSHALNRSLQLNYDFNTVYRATDIKVIFGWMNTSVKVPAISKQFRYAIEVSIPFLQHVYTGGVWYDSTSKLTRMDFHYNQPMSPYYTTEPLSVVTDYDDGIQYVIYRSSQNCSVQAIPAADYAAKMPDKSAANSTWYLQMKSPRDLFYIDDTYHFVGQKTIRGMLCNVFETIRNDFKVPQFPQPMHSIFRYSFLASAWSETGELSDGVSAQPVRLQVTAIEAGFYIEYNMFDYSGDLLDSSVFDVHQCLGYQKRQRFQISFPGPYSSYLNSSSSAFLSAAISKLASTTGTSLLRFQRSQLDYDNQNIYITTSLSGLPDYSTYFTHVVNGSVVQQADLVLGDANSARQCANTCFSFSNFTCNSYYYSPNDRQCLLSRHHVVNVAHAIADFQSYSSKLVTYVYSGVSVRQRITLAMDNDSHGTVNPVGGTPPTLLKSFILLKNNIYMGRITITIPNSNHVFEASSVRSDIVSPGDHSASARAMQHFTMFVKNKAITSKQKNLLTVSIDACALACITETTFSCQGFTYMEPALECALHTAHPDRVKQAGLATSTGSSIFARNYIDAYTKIPGQMYEVGANGMKMVTATANDCAKYCSQLTTLPCRAFTYCGSLQMCLVYSLRAMGSRKPDTVTMCELYTSSYAMDFKDVNSGTFTFTNVIKITNVVFADCAALCIQEQGSDCKGFYYGATSGSCWLTAAPAGSAQVQTSANITDRYYYNLFQRQYYPAQSSAVSQPTGPPITGPPVTGQSSVSAVSGSGSVTTSRGHVTGSSAVSGITNPAGSTLKDTQVLYKTKADKGVVVGVAFAMLVVGLLGGVGGLHLFQRFRKTRNNDMKVNFVAHEDM